jgi:hypothetical protein
MQRSKLERYYLSIAPIKSLLEQGIISNEEYYKSEQFLANKYCIKKGNLYRLNDLTFEANKVIYGMTEEGVDLNETNNNENRSNTGNT